MTSRPRSWIPSGAVPGGHHRPHPLPIGGAEVVQALPVPGAPPGRCGGPRSRRAHGSPGAGGGGARFPYPGVTGIQPDQSISFAIANPSSTNLVQPGTIQLFLNTTNVTSGIVVNNNAAGAAVSYLPPALLPTGTGHVAGDLQRRHGDLDEHLAIYRRLGAGHSRRLRAADERLEPPGLYSPGGQRRR